MEPIGSSGLQQADFANSIRIANGARRQDHPLRADADPLRRPQRRRAALARAGRQHLGKARASWRRWRPRTASPSPSRTTRISPAASWSISASRPGRMSASSSTPPTPSRSPSRRSISPATIAPHVRYLHLKDYRVQFTDEGYRLVRCAIGDGAVPFARDGRDPRPSITSRCRRRSRSARSRRGTCGCSRRTGGTAMRPRMPRRLPRACSPRSATGCPTTPTTARRGRSRKTATR